VTFLPIFGLFLFIPFNATALTLLETASRLQLFPSTDSTATFGLDQANLQTITYNILPSGNPFNSSQKDSKNPKTMSGEPNTRLSTFLSAVDAGVGIPIRAAAPRRAVGNACWAEGGLYLFYGRIDDGSLSWRCDIISTVFKFNRA
jgi:hypothetical protein